MPKRTGKTLFEAFRNCLDINIKDLAGYMAEYEKQENKSGHFLTEAEQRQTVQYGINKLLDRLF
jgi:hypothetical protein